jgi:hypothetical protein
MKTGSFSFTSAAAVRICRDCGRLFDLAHEDQAEEWYYGHDCEVE